MKKLPFWLFVLGCLILTACGKGQQINGHTTNTAYRSVKALKNRLPPEKRIQFEVAFWTIRDAYKEDDTFLDIVDGKKPEEIIKLGEETYQSRKASGFKGYEKYTSWEDMISQFAKERDDQENRPGKPKEDPKDKANNVLYDLHSPQR